MPLADIQVRNAKPKTAPYKLADAEGMYLLVKPSGGKYWWLKYRYGGKEKVLALDVYPDVRLPDARQLRADAKTSLAEKRDPGFERKTKIQQVDSDVILPGRGRGARDRSRLGDVPARRKATGQ